MGIRLNSDVVVRCTKLIVLRSSLTLVEGLSDVDASAQTMPDASPSDGHFPRYAAARPLSSSTIGNLLVPEAVNLLRAMATTLGIGSMLLVGIDRIKDPSILLPAYDDAQGVTATFNLNLLHRINRERIASVPVDAFCYAAL
jgi:hypothetical protein